MIIHSNLSKMKNKILWTCLQGNYRGSLGEFSIGHIVCLELRGLLSKHFHAIE